MRDTGPGIPEEEIPKVLQAFGQGSLAHQTAEGGTGLGLAIVQNLIELHGGSLRAALRAAQGHRRDGHPAGLPRAARHAAAAAARTGDATGSGRCRRGPPRPARLRPKAAGAAGEDVASLN